MSKRIIRLSGERIRGARVSAELLRDLLDVLLEGTQRVIRLQVEGRSSARGSKPSWLDPASDFDLLSFEEGSTCVVIDPPTLNEAVPQMFAQQSLFGSVDADRSAYDYLVESLQDAAAGREDSELFDGPLINTFSKLEKLMKRGVDVIELEGARSLRLVPESIATIGRMKRHIPPSRHVRISGKLETIRHSDRRFVLLQDQGSIPGVAEDTISPEKLASLFGAQVVVSATAHFRPSGALLRIDAESVELADATASLWAAPPRPLLDSEQLGDLRKPQGPRSGLAAVMGKWPGDESDDEISDALRSLS